MSQSLKRLNRKLNFLTQLYGKSLTITAQRCHGMDHLNVGFQEDSPNKTTVSILNRETDSGLLFIDTYSNRGFRLNTGMRVWGPIALFPNALLQWNIGGVHDINIPSLSLYHMLQPKIDILILGTGAEVQGIDLKVIPFLKSKGITVEILPTDRACSIFNELNAEKRMVAAGLIPPTFIADSLESRGRDTVLTRADIVKSWVMIEDLKKQNKKPLDRVKGLFIYDDSFPHKRQGDEDAATATKKSLGISSPQADDTAEKDKDVDNWEANRDAALERVEKKLGKHYSYHLQNEADEAALALALGQRKEVREGGVYREETCAPVDRDKHEEKQANDLELVPGKRSLVEKDISRYSSQPSEKTTD